MSDQSGQAPDTPQDLQLHPASPVHRTASDIVRFGAGLRSASPAKRSRSERDADGDDSDTSVNSMAVDRSPSKKLNAAPIQSPLPSRTKAAPPDMAGQQPDSGNTSIRGDAWAGSVSSESNAVPVSSPPTSVDMDGDVNITTAPPSYDEQRDKLDAMIAEPLVEGRKGYVVPKAWLDKIFAKATSKGQQKENFSKEAVEDDVGPIDTRPILASHIQATSDFPKDGQDNPIALLAPGLSVGGVIELLPKEAWDLAVSWYGLARDSPPVIRFVVNTNDDPDGLPNLLYELYPTLFTLQKLVNEAGQGLESIGERGRKAVQIVASRSEKYQHFLKRVKAALELPARRKVQVWKILEVLQAGTGKAGIPTPMSSRGNSPAPPSIAASDLPNLTVDLNALSAMPEGSQRELLDLPDETTNEKYNGKLRLGQIGFPERQTLVVESTGPNSSDFASQKSTSKKAAESSSQAMVKSSSSSSATTSRPSANTRSSQTSNNARSIFSARGRKDRKGRIRGSIGLQNLGNTCYMNAALQCIRSVQELTAYFMKEKYKDDINTDNPLGHNGVIAKGYASLVAQFYSSDGGFAPRAFKSMVGRAQPLFSGYGQQDSQEFVGFLLDALHEDLNRIIKKPYFENPDSDDQRVHEQEYVRELGETYRSNYGKRNDSVVMDLFSGFYKNTMICPVCNKVSVTFDPYSQLTLQLPVENTFIHTFQVVPLEGTRVSVEVDVDKNTTFKSLKDYLAQRVHGLKADRLVFAEEYSEKLYKLFEDAESLGDAGITSNDKIVAYEVDSTPSNWPPLDKKKKKGSFLGLSSFSASSDPVPDMGSPASERMAIPVFNRLVKGNSRGSWVLDPFFILVTRDEAKDYEAILRKLLLRVNTMTTTDLFSDCEISSVQQSENEDISDNKNIPRIQARSVDGDEDFVDVSMTDGKPTAASTKTSPPSSPSLRAKILDQGTFLTPNLRDAFEINVFASNTEVVPVGWSTISENGKYQPLSERAHPRDARRMSNSSIPGRRSGSRTESRWMRGDDASSDMSEDELASSEHGLSHSTPDILPPPEEDSDGGDTSATEQSLGVKRGSHLKKSNVRGSIKRLGKSVRDSITRSKSRGKPEDYILKLGEALILDWNADIFESLFGGDSAEDLKGQRTDKDPPTVADPELLEKRERRAARKKKGITLDECFSETSKSEVLSEDNAWYCPSCKEFRRATKTLELWTVPDILIVHLKRFAGSGGRSLNNKVDLLVDFPVDGLDLGGRVGLSEHKSLVYDLFSVDNHYGGLGGGHYTAHAKNFLDGQWYEYNDSFVSKSTGEHAVTKAAYLLFYRRREPKHLGPPSLQHFVEEVVDSDSDEGEPGKDRAGDSSSSGSSEDSGLGGHTSARRLAGAGGGKRDEKPPEYDEAIAMGDDNDNEVHELEGSSSTQAPGMAFGGQNWGFDRLGQSQGVTAPPGSDNEMGESDSSTLASDEPNVGDGEDLGARMMDFADTAEPLESDGGQMAHLPPGSDDSQSITHVTPMDHEQDDAVAEVRLSDEEKDR